MNKQQPDLNSKILKIGYKMLLIGNRDYLLFTVKIYNVTKYLQVNNELEYYYYYYKEI